MIASSLFHFTNDLDTVIKIISSGKFRASYNIEDVSDFYPSEKYVAIPMVCFCDIPLKFIVEHTKNYGKFGIGLDKEKWGIKNGINPILYRSESHVNSLLNDTLSATETDFIEGLNLDREKESVLIHRMAIVKDNMLRLANYTKKYQIGDTLYYLEREWRFVPEVAELPFLKRDSEHERKLINDAYFKGNPDYVPFRTEDIKYIVVPNKDEVIQLIHKIRNLIIKDEEKYKLIQLIIDLESIEKDF